MDDKNHPLSLNTYARVMAYRPEWASGIALIVDKPWGREIWFADESAYLGKLLAVTAGHRLSYQLHREKCETLLVLDGVATVRLGHREFQAPSGTAFTVPANTPHRFGALTDLLLVEVSTHHPEDVVRLEDDFGRAS